MVKNFIALLIGLLGGCVFITTPNKKNVPELVPLPKNYSEYKENGLLLNRLVIGINDSSLSPLVKVFESEIRVISSIEIGETKNIDSVNLEIDLDHKLLEDEYKIVINKVIILKAGSYQAACWATTSLVQLMNQENEKLIFPVIKISDHPSFKYRGLMIDLATNWTDPAIISSLIQICRFYKIPYLQLHLTDDQSFTFPSRSFPKLATPNRHYTNETLKELVRFADERGVTLIPELDLPGHSSAMRKAMPELFGKEDLGVIDLTRPEVLNAVNAIVKEMALIFQSSPYIHIGCDEADFSKLGKLSETKEILKEKGFTSVQDLFYEYIVEMNNTVKSLGKKTLIWESFSGNGSIMVPIPNDIVVLAWETLYQRPDSLILHNYNIINASWKPLYITPGFRWKPEDIYNNWDIYTWKNYWKRAPSYNTIKVQPSNKILGAQLCSWEMQDYMQVPEIMARMPCFTEKTWNTHIQIPYNQFTTISNNLNIKLQKLIFPARLTITGISASIYPDLEYTNNNFADSVTIKCSPFSKNNFITFTLNEDFPTVDSETIPDKLTFVHSQEVKIAVYNSTKNSLGYYHNYFIKQPLRFIITGAYKLPADINVKKREILIEDSIRVFIKVNASKGAVFYKTNGMNNFCPYSGKEIIVKSDSTIFAKLTDKQNRAIGNEIVIYIKKLDEDQR
jgi:hexosaminidase